MTYHPTVDQILALLKENDVWFETFEHEPVRTSEEAAQMRDGYTLHQGAKALIVRVKESKKHKYFLMLVLPGDQKFDTTKVKALLNARDIRFATVEEVTDITHGVEPGGVPPFGNLFDLRTIVDPVLFENEKIIFNAGDRSFSIGMKSQDYQMVVAPEIRSLIQ